MKLTIEGKKFCITGDLEGHTRAAAQAAIVEAGGLIARSVGPRTDVLVCGDSPGPSKLRKARTLGIPVIDQAQLFTLVSGATIELGGPTGEPNGDAARDLIGEARAVLDGTPSSESWSALVALLDSCAPVELPRLVDFVAPQVARWELPPSGRWRPDHTEGACHGAPEEWFRGMPRGELRVAPFRWAVEMNNGLSSPKHQLVRAVNARGMKMNGTSIVRLLSGEHLSNLTQLDLDSNALTRTFWRRLRSLPSTETLTRLRFSEIDTDMADAAQGGHHLDGLTHLDLYTHFKTTQGGFARLLVSPMVQNVEVLTVGNRDHAHFMECLDDPALLPRLRRIVLEGDSPRSMRAAFRLAVCSRVDEVAIRLSSYEAATVNAKLGGMIHDHLARITSGARGPRLLDLSELLASSSHETARGEVMPQRLESTLLRVFEGWTPPRLTTTVRQGELESPPLAQLLRERGLEVAS